jgi:haloalkane dehalogenase
MDTKINFTEHHISRSQGNLYARDYPGDGPAFVLMHGFPDNLGIYDALVPVSVAGGRRVVTFDFLGFGRSDKPGNATYTFADQLQDLGAVVAGLKLEKFVPVAHDSSGPSAINYTLANPHQIAELIILNSGYDDAYPMLWPEMVTLFATNSLGALGGAIAQSPAQFGWLLGWQKEKFSDSQPVDQKERFDNGVGRLIADNFTKQPSSGPAFMNLASHFFAELARNTKRLPELKNLNTSVKVIWGELDPYFPADVARDRASHFKNASLHLLPAGHWLQADVPTDVGRLMLA